MKVRISLAAVAVLLAACGGSSSNDDATPAVVVETAAPTVAVDDTTSSSGDSPSADPEGGTASAAGSDEELALEFSQCMRDNGADFPDPTVEADGSISFFGDGGGPGAQQDPAFGDALEVCGEIVQGASFLPGGGDINEIEDQLLEFAQCLRDEGLDVDDPDLSNFTPGSGGTPFGPNFDPQDPANQDAIDACSGLLAFAGGGA